MKKAIYILAILLFFYCARQANAQNVSSTELIEKAAYYNNKTVEYQGEVVGDVMVRGDSCWVNLNDGVNAIGMWADTDLIKDIIKYQGDYNHKGDTILVAGIFHKACPQHGGDLDIHLSSAAKIKEGFSIEHPLNPAKIKNALGLFFVAMGLSILYNIRRKRK